MKRQLIEDVDYSFIYPKNDGTAVHIKLLSGPFKDTVFKYGKVKFEPAGEMMALKFAYDVIESNVMKPRKMEKDENFKNYIGDLLVEIIGANMDQEFSDEIGTDDIEKPHLQ